MLEKIVSGGQTGVDRGALDAALDRGFPIGGWLPKGRKAEDGAVPDRYAPMQEAPRADYPWRTGRNVVDSDATLVLAPDPAHLSQARKRPSPSRPSTASPHASPLCSLHSPTSVKPPPGSKPTTSAS